MNTSYSKLATGTHLVHPREPFTARLAEEISQSFTALSDQGVERVVVNLADVLFIDSRGLAALVAGYKIFGNHPLNFRLAAPQDQPKLLFDLTGFDQIFQIFNSVAEALEAESDSQAQFGQNFSIFVS